MSVSRSAEPQAPRSQAKVSSEPSPFATPAAPTSAPSSVAQKQEPAPDEPTTIGVNQFSFDFWNAVSEGKQGGNRALSPLSVQLAFSMVLAGAVEDTERELASALRVPADKATTANGWKSLLADFGSHSSLILGQGVFVQKGLEPTPAFRDGLGSLQGSYRAVNFADGARAARAMNSWALEASRGRLSAPIFGGEFEPKTRLALASIAHFAADWLLPFSRARTYNESFKLSAERSVSIPMMHAEHKLRWGMVASGSKGQSKAAKVELLELPYRDEAYAMLVVLPPESMPLDEVTRGLSARTFELWLAQMAQFKVDVSLPKFDISTPNFDLRPALRHLGVDRVFKPEDALLSLTVDGEKMFVSQATHQASMRCDEKGTVATAVTKVGAVAVSADPDQRLFKANRPFLTFLFHKPTKTILFIAQVSDPSLKGE